VGGRQVEAARVVEPRDDHFDRLGGRVQGHTVRFEDRHRGRGRASDGGGGGAGGAVQVVEQPAGAVGLDQADAVLAVVGAAAAKGELQVAIQAELLELDAVGVGPRTVRDGRQTTAMGLRGQRQEVRLDRLQL